MKKSLFKSAVYNVIYQFLNVLFPILSASYVARVLLPEGVGLAAYAQNIASYVLLLVPLGVGSYGVRVIAQSYGDEKTTSLRFWELFAINGFSTVFFTGLYYGAVLLLPQFGENRSLFLIAGIPILANAIQIDWLYQGLEEYSFITLRSFLVKLVSLLCLVAFVREPSDVVPYLLVSTGAACVSSIFNVIHARKLIQWNVQGFSLGKHILPELILAVNLLLANLYSKVDITMMGAMGDTCQVGYYANAMKLVQMIMSTCAAVTAAFLPRLSYYYKTNRQGYEELIRKGLQIILFIGVPATAGIALVAPALIPLLFGDAFAPAAVTVQLLCPLILIKSLGDLLCYQILISMGQEKRQTPVYCCAAVLNIGLNALLIPRMAQNGAAVASVLSELLINAVLLLYTRKLVHIQMTWNNTARTLLATVLMILAAAGCMGLHSTDLARAASAVTAGIAVYGTASLLLKNEITARALDLYLKMRRRP